MNKIISLLILSIVVIVSLTSCEDNNYDTNEYFSHKSNIKWGCSKIEVMAQMSNCWILLDTEQMLCYQSKNEIIAFAFNNNKLNTISMIPDNTLSLNEILQDFTSYQALKQYKNFVFLNKSSNTIAEIENTSGFYTISWSNYGLDIANAIDLGLSVKWADVNLDLEYSDYAALTPENNKIDTTKYINYLIGWGDSTGKNTSPNLATYPNINSISGTNYDIARTKWGGKWRIATPKEYQELITVCAWTWEKRNGHYGYKVTGPNGNSIFLPTTGYRDNNSLNCSYMGYYWTGTAMTNPYPYVLIFDQNNVGLNISSHSGVSNPIKTYGCAIRPVQ